MNRDEVLRVCDAIDAAQSDLGTPGQFSLADWSARLRAAVEGEGWQPIESAPRDGTPIDLWFAQEGGYRYAGAMRLEGKWQDFTHFEFGEFRMQPLEYQDPTHWQPLPPPPPKEAQS